MFYGKYAPPMAIGGKRNLESSLADLDSAVKGIRPRAGGALVALDRWRTESAAVLFHLRRGDQRPMLLSILGGTGTGKSTVVNRLLSANVSAASFRRTFTAGAVAVASSASSIPSDWLGLDRVVATQAELPARGQSDSLVVVESPHELLKSVTLVDTPDLDGDQPSHHAQADRAFRWSQAVLFLVSPEKYQMTELLPYYRLARRYGVTVLFVMNKCQTPEMLEDYRKLLEGTVGKDAALFSIARDDAGYEPPADANLAALRAAIGNLAPDAPENRLAGNRVRVVDLLGRLRDQVIGPLRKERADIHGALATLKSLESPPPGVDVNPLTEQLQRRLQQRSVLYLIGPGRILDRVRQVPGMIVRLPRTAWDALFRGKISDPLNPPEPAPEARELPDFHATLKDQFLVVQSRIDDCLRATPTGQRWFNDSSYASSKIDADDAGKIADEELNDLKDWLQRRWNATPRDTVLLLRLLRHLPGGEKLTQWSEAAPYLLAIVVATHHAFFGHIDLMILGGYSLATWITERLSNEVASRTRKANRAIASRFGRLTHEQIRKTIAWLQAQAPSAAEIDDLETMANRLEESIQTVTG
jgi:hypothetical protein